MTIHSASCLIDSLRTFRLISAEQYQRLCSETVSKGADPRPVAKQLIQRGLLTVYQVNQMFAGRGKELTVGSYRVVDRLGQGGLSTVYKARHVDHDFLVALKMIRPDVMANAEGRRQFLQEIDAMARLDHPNIVQFCDADQHEDTCYFAMEYIDGIDLGKQVELSGPASIRDACDYIRQAAMGLQHAYERNLVHRDIKPVNLFLTQSAVARSRSAGEKHRARPLVKVLDWGLALLRGSGDTTAESTNHVAKGLVGTADYLSPEQARKANAVDIRGDVYSLGCAFYYLLTGQPPFPSGTLMQKILQHQQAEPVAIGTFRDDVPDGLSAVLCRMMAKKADDRYQTPAAVALALLPFTRSTNAAASLRVLAPMAG